MKEKKNIIVAAALLIVALFLAIWDKPIIAKGTISSQPVVVVAEDCAFNG